MWTQDAVAHRPGAAGSPARVGGTPYAQGRELSSGVPRPGSLPLVAGVCTASTGASGIRRGTAGLLPSRAPAVPRRSHALAGSPRELTTGVTAPRARTFAGRRTRRKPLLDPHELLGAVRLAPRVGWRPSAQDDPVRPFSETTVRDAEGGWRQRGRTAGCSRAQPGRGQGPRSPPPVVLPVVQATAPRRSSRRHAHGHGQPHRGRRESNPRSGRPQDGGLA